MTNYQTGSWQYALYLPCDLVLKVTCQREGSLTNQLTPLQRSNTVSSFRQTLIWTRHDKQAQLVSKSLNMKAVTLAGLDDVMTLFDITKNVLLQGNCKIVYNFSKRKVIIIPPLTKTFPIYISVIQLLLTQFSSDCEQYNNRMEYVACHIW